MINEETTMVDPTKVRGRVSEYIVNRGYQRERTFSPDRLDIYFVDKLGNRHDGFISMPKWTAILPFAPTHNFWENMKVLMSLKDLFKPVGRVYQEGRQLYSEASVLTPKYVELSEKNRQDLQNIERLFKTATQEIEEIRAKSRMLKRWWLSRRSKALKEFYQGILSSAHYDLPKPVPREASFSALSKLYDWLQVGEEDPDSKKARDALAHSSDQLTSEQILLLRVERDLYKIKSHTAIVCLDQLKQDGLTLDAVVSQEIGKISREYLRDVYYWNENVSAPFRLRTGNPNSFGAGLCDVIEKD